MKNPLLHLVIYLLGFPFIALFVNSELGIMRTIFLYIGVLCFIGAWVAVLIDAIRDKKLNPIWIVFIFTMGSIAVPVYLYKKHQLNKSLQH
jgi:lipopolysaccharide export LptBFGC system permease protein LptF